MWRSQLMWTSRWAVQTVVVTIKLLWHTCTSFIRHLQSCDNTPSGGRPDFEEQQREDRRMG
jgi:hypothetical protein